MGESYFEKQNKIHKKKNLQEVLHYSRTAFGGSFSHTNIANVY